MSVPWAAGCLVTSNPPSYYHDRLCREADEEMYESKGLNDIRIGTKDRERYIIHLGNMYAEGYLTDDEFKTRADNAATAQTYGYLQGLVKDLPSIPAEVRDLWMETECTGQHYRIPGWLLGIWVAATLILLGIALAALL